MYKNSESNFGKFEDFRGYLDKRVLVSVKSVMLN